MARFDLQSPRGGGVRLVERRRGHRPVVVVEKITADDILVPLALRSASTSSPSSGSRRTSSSRPSPTGSRPMATRAASATSPTSTRAAGSCPTTSPTGSVLQRHGTAPRPHRRHPPGVDAAAGRGTRPAVRRRRRRRPAIVRLAGRIELDALVAIAPAGTLTTDRQGVGKPYRPRDLRDALAEAEAADEVAVRAWDAHSADHRRRLARLDGVRRRIRWRSIQGHATLDTPWP